MNQPILVIILFLIFGLLVIYFFPISFGGSSQFCTQQIVTACHNLTGECREFPNSCNLPYFWTIR